jgi:hypothetical protein
MARNDTRNNRSRGQKKNRGGYSRNATQGIARQFCALALKPLTDETKKQLTGMMYWRDPGAAGGGGIGRLDRLHSSGASRVELLTVGPDGIHCAFFAKDGTHDVTTGMSFKISRELQIKGDSVKIWQLIG